MTLSQNQYPQRKQGTELTCASPTAENLERKIDAITAYQKPYIRNIFINMARANPQNAIILHDYIIAQKNELNIKESTLPDLEEHFLNIELLRFRFRNNYFDRVFTEDCDVLELV